MEDEWRGGGTRVGGVKGIRGKKGEKRKKKDVIGRARRGKKRGRKYR